MPIITLNNGQSVYVTEDQYAQLLQTQHQTAMQPQSALDFGSSAVGGAGTLIGLTNLFGEGAASGTAGAAEAAGAAGAAGAAEAAGAAGAAGEAAGVLGAATPYLGIAGAGLGAYGLYNAMREGDKQGSALSGAGLGAGLAAAAPLLGLGPVGWGGLLLAGGAGALGGYGLSSLFGEQDKYKTEFNRAQALRDKGINWGINTQEPTRGRSKEELVAEEQRKIDAGGYGNTAFAQSRLESDLTPEDIWGYANWGEKFGNDWMGTTEANRRAIAERALQNNLVREHHGTIDVNFTPELEEYAKGLLEKPLQDSPKQGNNNIPSSIPQPPKQRKPKPLPPNFGGGVPSNPAATLQPYSSRYSPLSFQGMLQTMRGGQQYA